MLFNSLPFLFFLPLAFLLYWISPAKVRWITLLAISMFYYLAFGSGYIIMLLCTIVVTWKASLMLGNIPKSDERHRKLVLFGALIISLGFLFFFKYFNFMLITATRVLNLLSFKLDPFTLKLMLPVGISFYTFMSVSYLVDVYKGKISPEPNLARYALFVSFFPHIVMGPIGRADALMPQLFPEEKKPFNAESASIGLRMMLWGLFKKLIIADSLGKYVDTVYGNVQNYFGLTLIMAVLMYSFQIYCDFSGYTDIAIGTAKLFNINLAQNFKSPYFSKSIKEFWSRWHISLSTWLRDYVYIPLGGSRCSKWKRDRNLMATFMVSGLWHGASWTFVLWGMLHACFQIAEGWFKKPAGDGMNIRDMKPVKGGKAVLAALAGVGLVIFTFLRATFAWIFFRVDTFKDAVYIITHLHNGVILHFFDAWEKMMSDLAITDLGLWKLLASIIALSIYDFISLKRDIPTEFGKLPTVLRWAVYLGLTSLIIVSKLHGGTTQSFIYFNF